MRIFKADGSVGPNTARGIVAYYDISPERGAHLLGQVVHESGSFKLTKENLHYSAECYDACLAKLISNGRKCDAIRTQPESTR